MSTTEEDLLQQLQPEGEVGGADELEALRQQYIAESAERERLFLAAQRRAEHLDSPFEEFGHGVTLGISNSVGIPVDAVSAILNAAGIDVSSALGSGDSIYDVMEELGAVPEDLPRDAIGPVGTAGEFTGIATVVTPLMLAPFLKMAMDPDFEAKQFSETIRFGGTAPEGQAGHIPRSRAARAAFVMRQIGQNIARSAVKSPKTFIAAETAGAIGAGLLTGAAEEAGASPAVQVGAGVIGGVVPSAAVSAIPRALTSAWRWGMRNMLPFSESGGLARISGQTQARTESVDRAIGALDKGVPEGVTPARAIGEERLMAQEQRILRDNPELDLAVREDLQAASRRTQSDLAELYGTPQGKADWEFAVVSRVAPDDVRITPGARVEDMLEEAADGFGPLYQQMEGWPIRNRLIGSRKTTLDTMVKNSSNSQAVMAGAKERKVVASWLENQMSALRRKTKTVQGVKEYYDSKDLLKLRSNIRRESRKQARLGNGERAELLRVAEKRVNQLMKNQLNPELLKELNRVDNMYRQFKIVDNAAAKSGDKGLTPDALVRSLRESIPSRTGYADGEMLDMLALTQMGRPVTPLMNNPGQAARIAQTLSEEGLNDMKAQYVEELMRRSISNDLTPDGREVISGIRMQSNLNKFRKTANSLGFSEDELARLEEVIRQIRMIEQKSPAAVNQLFEDGPNTIFELMATLIGAKSGQRMAGTGGKAGTGSALVMAGFMAKKWRNLLGKFTSDKATDLAISSVRDEDLYRTLLTNKNASAPVKNEAYQRLNAFLAEPGRFAGEEAMKGVEALKEEEKAKRKKELEDLRNEAMMIVPF
jgi:hypothetical protein